MFPSLTCKYELPRVSARRCWDAQHLVKWLSRLISTQAAACLLFWYSMRLNALPKKDEDEDEDEGKKISSPHLWRK